jgi:hypothetical protein
MSTENTITVRVEKNYKLKREINLGILKKNFFSKKNLKYKKKKIKRAKNKITVLGRRSPIHDRG